MQKISPQELAERLKSAQNAVAFTGAGISTEAGLADFRGPHGLYTTGKYDPDLVFEINYFRQHPRMFFEFSLDFIQLIEKIKPTFTHHFLNDLEQKDLLQGIITQNIDTLHHMAGSRTIAELHGSYWSAGCLECDYLADGLDIAWWKQKMETSPDPPIPQCPDCGGVLKPDVVFFGEPVTAMETAHYMVMECDLLLVLGSSLTVYPAAMLPQIATGTVVIINKGAVPLQPNQNRYFVDSGLDDFFRQVAEHI